MVRTATPLLALTAQDVMSREVVTIPRQMSLREAARLLRRASVSGAPVVDEQGRCVGVLSAADFLRWAEDGCPAGGEAVTRTCCYQVDGRLLDGTEAVLCTLAEGACPLQGMRSTTGGRHTAGALLVDQGVHLRVIQEILGHSDVRVTERYTHVASPAEREAAGRMGAALWGADSAATATTTATNRNINTPSG